MMEVGQRADAKISIRDLEDGQTTMAGALMH